MKIIINLGQFCKFLYLTILPLGFIATIVFPRLVEMSGVIGATVASFFLWIMAVLYGIGIIDKSKEE